MCNIIILFYNKSVIESNHDKDTVMLMINWNIIVHAYYQRNLMRDLDYKFVHFENPIQLGSKLQFHNYYPRRSKFAISP